MTLLALVGISAFGLSRILPPSAHSLARLLHIVGIGAIVLVVIAFLLRDFLIGLLFSRDD